MPATRHIRRLSLVRMAILLLALVWVYVPGPIEHGVTGRAFAAEDSGSEPSKTEESEGAEEGAKDDDLPTQAERDRKSAQWEAERRETLTKRSSQEEEIDELVKELEQNPDDFELNYKLGNAYHEANYPHSALIHFDRAAELKPDDSRVWVNRGVLLKELARADEAETSFRRAIEVNPGDALAHINLGDMLLTQKKYPEAVDEYREAIEVDPGSPNAYYSLAIAFAECGMFRDASRAWRTCARMAEKRGGPLDAGNAERALENARLMDEILADAETKVREREEKKRELEAASQDKKAKSD